jgi:hypothetical protein
MRGWLLLCLLAVGPLARVHAEDKVDAPKVETPQAAAPLAGAPTAGAPIAIAPFAFGPVVLGGGGAVPGIVLHPLVKDLAYIRTDVGGAYRWDEPGKRWLPLLDHLTADRWNLYGVDSLAVDPTDALGGTVAAALGKYQDDFAQPRFGRLVLSRNRGQTWKEIGPELRIASNRQQARGERLAFDRLVPDRLWYASLADGLWRGKADGTGWERVPLPGDKPDAPLALAAIITACEPPPVKAPAPKKIKPGEKAPPAAPPAPEPIPPLLWVATIDQGVLASSDDGATWKALGGPVLKPTRMVACPDTTLLVAHEGGLQRHDGTAWHDLTPPGVKAGIQAIACDPRQPRNLIAAERITHKARLFRSTDAGATWTVLQLAQNRTRAWWPAWHWVSSPFSVAFDPQRPGRVWLTDWYAAYRCDNLNAAAPTLTNLTDGLEEIVTLSLLAPASGANQLLSGVADNGGFAHPDVDKAPARNVWAAGAPDGITITGLDADPTGQMTVQVGVGGGDRKGPALGAWSADGGTSWTAFATLPPVKPASGRVAVTADGTHVVWALHGQQGVYWTDDLGATWRDAGDEARQAVGKGGIWNWQQPLAADRVAPRTVYLLSDHHLLRTTDGGRTWTAGANVTSTGMRAIATHPFHAGELWVARGKEGLARSSDGGLTFTALPAMSSAELVSLGAGTDNDHPLLYAIGTAGGRTGLFLSRDLGATVEAVASPQQAFGNQPNTLVGDPRTPGRGFVGTNGRGILWFQVTP